MRALFRYWVTCVRRSLRGRRDLVCEVAALRQQLHVYTRQNKKPKLERGDRIFWIWLSRHWTQWKSALVIVKPKTEDGAGLASGGIPPPLARDLQARTRTTTDSSVSTRVLPS